VTTFETSEGRAHHGGQIARHLRVGHRIALGSRAGQTHQQIRDRFDDSSFSRAWFVDGRLAALGGVCGGIISPEGFVWLAITEAATRFPIAMTKEALKHLGDVMLIKRRLTTVVLRDDLASVRFAEALGFDTIETDRTAYLMEYWGNN
jgi:hypothetical protein